MSIRSALGLSRPSFESSSTWENDLHHESKPAQTQTTSKRQSRIGLLFRVVIPQYGIPLMLAIMGSELSITGFSTTFQKRHLFKLFPGGNLPFELTNLASGAGNVVFASISLYHALPYLWTWASIQLIIVFVAMTQFFHPFLGYFPVWLVFVFLTGGIEGLLRRTRIIRSIAISRREERVTTVEVGL